MMCYAEMSPDDLPGGIASETLADCPAKRCNVGDTGLDHHRVVVTNYGMVPYEVVIVGVCETPDIEYKGIGGPWRPPMLRVPGRPGRGGKTKLSRQEQIASKNPGERPTIRTDVQFGGVGRPKMNGTLVFEVKTV